MRDLKAALRTALTTRFGVAPGALTDDSELFSSGLIDSMSVITLVSFLEAELGVPIPPTDITLENLDSISRIVTYAARLTGKQSP